MKIFKTYAPVLIGLLVGFVVEEYLNKRFDISSMLVLLIGFVGGILVSEWIKAVKKK
ncbi:hypothetical protein [Pediococcus stilesii]|uniref:hypothetical protein n=1 Tax=Pediococcus stilesii TaxID=331679 RepID=UPI0014863CEA|nr:hypothetical protein [Pediococcus stilesii]